MLIIDLLSKLSACPASDHSHVKMFTGSVLCAVLLGPLNQLKNAK